MDGFENPPADAAGRESAAVPYEPGEEDVPQAPTSVSAAAVQRHRSALLAIDGVQGVGVGRDPIGDEAVVVFVRDSAVASRVPHELDAVPVVTEVVGEVDAQGL